MTSHHLPPVTRRPSLLLSPVIHCWSSLSLSVSPIARQSSLVTVTVNIDGSIVVNPMYVAENIPYQRIETAFCAHSLEKSLAHASGYRLSQKAIPCVGNGILCQWVPQEDYQDAFVQTSIGPDQIPHSKLKIHSYSPPSSMF